MRFLIPVLIAAAFLLGSVATAQQVSASQPSLVGAPTMQAPAADPGVPGAWTKLTKALKQHRYREVVAVLLTMLVFLWRRFLFGFVMHRLSSQAVGILTVVLAFLGTLPTALTAEPFSWGNFVWDALVSSGEAMLLWQLILKRLPGFQVAAPPAKPDAPIVAPPGM